MFDVNGYQIRISRGDTGLLTLCAEGGIEMTQDDRAVLTIRRRSGAPILEMSAVPDENNRVQFGFTHEMTERWQPGVYEWDVRYVLGAEMHGEEVTGGREVATPIPPSEFIVTRTVGVL